MAKWPSPCLDPPAQGSSGSSRNIVPGASSNSGVRASQLNPTPWVPLAGLLPGAARRVSVRMGTAVWVGRAYCWPFLTLSAWLPEPVVTARCPPEDTGKPGKVPDDTCE